MDNKKNPQKAASQEETGKLNALVTLKTLLMFCVAIVAAVIVCFSLNRSADNDLRGRDRKIAKMHRADSAAILAQGNDLIRHDSAIVAQGESINLVIQSITDLQSTVAKLKKRKAGNNDQKIVELNAQIFELQRDVSRLMSKKTLAQASTPAPAAAVKASPDDEEEEAEEPEEEPEPED